ncbi:hypothetical protein ON010_g11501 [Phytophthora cinnamomi]|nr:hypothetical protein ON010_g11501 [Phytophthora cinnamomi]
MLLTSASPARPDDVSFSTMDLLFNYAPTPRVPPMLTVAARSCTMAVIAQCGCFGYEANPTHPRCHYFSTGPAGWCPRVCGTADYARGRSGGTVSVRVYLRRRLNKWTLPAGRLFGAINNTQETIPTASTTAVKPSRRRDASTLCTAQQASTTTTTHDEEKDDKVDDQQEVNQDMSSQPQSFEHSDPVGESQLDANADIGMDDANTETDTVPMLNLEGPCGTDAAGAAMYFAGHEASPANSMEFKAIVSETPPSDLTPGCSPTSSTDFEMGGVVAAPAGALSIEEWLGSLYRAQVHVPANGQCLFYAVCASTTNVQAEVFKPTPAQIRSIDEIKRFFVSVVAPAAACGVLDLGMANLRYDVQLNFVDPVPELRRLYPGAPAPTSTARVTAALFAHYAEARATSVTTNVSGVFWEGPRVLRALAVYLREPVYVWDVGVDGTAHVQQYAYQTFTMLNCDKHETGTVLALSDDRARDILEECFYNHHCGRRRTGLAGRHGVLDVYAKGPQESAIPDERTRPTLARVQLRPGEQVHPEVYARLLKNPDVESLSIPDRRHAQRLRNSNHDDFSEWFHLYGTHFEEPPLRRGRQTWQDYLEWFMVLPVACRHVLSYLPFPELPVMLCSAQQLLLWGEREVLRQQLQTLQRIAEDEGSDDCAREYCRSWLQECGRCSSDDALEKASDGGRWHGLSTYVDASLLRYRPPEIAVARWYIRLVLPYAVRDWGITPMGRAASGARAIWYSLYPEVAALCQDVEQRNDWSRSLVLAVGTGHLSLSASRRTDEDGVSTRAL